MQSSNPQSPQTVGEPALSKAWMIVGIKDILTNVPLEPAYQIMQVIGCPFESPQRLPPQIPSLQ